MKKVPTTHLITYQHYFLDNKIKLVTPYFKKISTKYALKKLRLFFNIYKNHFNFWVLNKQKSMVINTTNFKTYQVNNASLVSTFLPMTKINLNSFRYASYKFNKSKVLRENLNFRYFFRNRSHIKFKNNKHISYLLTFQKAFSFNKLITPYLFLSTNLSKFNYHNHDKQFGKFPLVHKIFTSNFSNLGLNQSIFFLKTFSTVPLQKSITHYYKGIYSYLFTKHKNPFILLKCGVFLPKIFLYKNGFKPQTYVLKKKMYSFLRINEYRMHIFRIKKILITNKIFQKIKSGNFFKKNLFMSNKIFYNFFRNVVCKLKNRIRSVYNVYNVFLSEGLFSKSNLFKYTGGVQSSLRNKLTLSRKSSVVIPRIRFKPGYQRIWRQFRIALGESINFKYLYQKQLTRFLVKFYRRSSSSQFSFNENQIIKVVIYSRLVPDHLTFDLFFRNSLIFLNSSVLKSNTIYVYKNDFIQIEISNWYYIFCRWISNLVLSRGKKFRRLVFKKSLASRYKLMKQSKQRSNYTPKWIKNTVFDFSDIKPFLEVDFFTLSCFIIYDFNRLTYYTPQDIKVIKFNLYRLYNWKYIT